MSFQTNIKIHFDDADPAGIAFSGIIFTKVHRCFEEFVEALGQDPEHFFLNSELITPIRHVETEYFGPLKPLRTYPVSISVLKINESSFQLEFLIKDSAKTLCSVKSTHVCVAKANMQKCPIPEDLKESLKKFESQK